MDRYYCNQPLIAKTGATTARCSASFSTSSKLKGHLTKHHEDYTPALKGKTKDKPGVYWDFTSHKAQVNTPIRS